LNAIYPFQKSPRCGATSKRTHKPCQAPAVYGWTVCRFHGAGGGAPKGKRNGNYRNGEFVAEAQVCRVAVSRLLRQTRGALAEQFKSRDKP
jgi:hypothetical protein